MAMQLGSGVAFAAAEVSWVDFNFFFNTIVIIAAAVVFAVGVFKFVQYVNSVKSEEPGRPRPEGASVVVYDREEIEDAIFRELSNSASAVPKEQAKAAVEALAKVFNEELNKKAAAVSKELGAKYEAVIKEKDQQYGAIRERYRETLGDKKQTESVIRSIADGLVVLNDKGEVIMLNPAAEKILGVELQNQVGRPLDQTVSNEQLMSLVKNREDTGDKEIEVKVQDANVEKVIKSSSAVIENENGQTIGMVSVLRDVTKQKELDDMKSRFFSTVSHELRTPLVAIKNAIALLLDEAMGPLTKDQGNFIDVADRNLKRLSLLIDDILDFSKLEAKKMRLDIAPASIEDVIKEVCDTFAAWAQTKQIKLTWKVAKGIPDVNFDPDRIMQVLSNLVNNSIKFSLKNGAINVEALIRESGGKKELLVSVADTGVGIAKEDISKLFTRFQQVGKNVTSEVGGTGLGLHICKELIELHGGRIWVESEPDKGARFIFTIPADTITVNNDKEGEIKDGQRQEDKPVAG